MTEKDLNLDFNPAELDKYFDLRQNLESAFTEKLVFVKIYGVNDKVYYGGIGCIDGNIVEIAIKK